MKRSVIQLAGRTLLVSLPAKWAAVHNIKKGDELDVVEDGHKMVINSDKNSSIIETKELNADQIGHLIRKYIFALYKKGTDEIRINYSDPSIVDLIRKTILNETVGYEIVSQTPKSCVIKLITSGSITEFDNLLRRIFLILLSMADETLESIKNKDFEHLSKTALLEEPNNRLTVVCRRSLNKWGTENFNKIGPIYYIVEELENLADEYNFLCWNLYNLRDSKEKTGIRSEVIAIFEKVNSMLRAFYEVFYKFDLNKFKTLNETRKEVVKEAHDVLENKNPSAAETYVLHHGVSIMERVYCMIGPYLILVN